jgi:hypothetical protein
MVFVAAIVVGLLFGGADQYLGSLIRVGPWTVAVSQMSAPWLILPLAFGFTQLRPARAALAGFIATAAALTGYFAMTLSPVEGVGLNTALAGVPGLIGSNLQNIVGGAVTAPICGLIGQRARTGRWWPAAALVAGALVLEPAARQVVGERFPPLIVWRMEAALGVAVLLASVIAFAVGGATSRNTGRPDG